MMSIAFVATATGCAEVGRVIVGHAGVVGFAGIFISAVQRKFVCCSADRAWSCCNRAAQLSAQAVFATSF